VSIVLRHLAGNANLSTLLTIVRLRYIVFEIPANLFTKWLGPGKAIPLYTIVFGVLSIACGFVNTFGAALAVRFLLGLAEAGELCDSGYRNQLLSFSTPRHAARYRLLPVSMVHQG
jgi:MFS family permease